MRKLTALILALIMCFSLVNIPASATDVTENMGMPDMGMPEEIIQQEPMPEQFCTEPVMPSPEAPPEVFETEAEVPADEATGAEVIVIEEPIIEEPIIEETVNEEAVIEEAAIEETVAEKSEAEKSSYAVSLPEGFIGEAFVEAGQTYSFTFRETPEDADLCSYLFEAVMQGEAVVPVGVKQLDDNSFQIVDMAAWEPIAVTGDLTILYLGAEGKAFPITADISELSRAWDTLTFPTDEEGGVLPGVYGQEEPYTVLIRHEEDKRSPDGGEEGEAEYIYSMPGLKIKDKNGVWQDYFGYYLETVTDDAEYAKLWKLCIPGKDITGEMMIFADRDEKSLDDPEMNPVRSISFRDSYGSAEENIEGLSVFSHEAFDAQSEKARDYYFSLKKTPNLRQIFYSVDGEEHEMEAVGESLYRISKEELTGDVVVTIKDPFAPETYSVTKQGSGKGEEAYIELSSDTAVAGQAYSFKVLYHNMSFADMTVTVTIGGQTYTFDDLQVSFVGDTAAVTVPASMITDNILITARIIIERNCRLVFEDAYYAASGYLKYRFTAFKIVLVSENNGAVTRTLLDEYMDPATRSISIEIPLHEKLYFEVVLPKENVYGKYYTDPNTSCYLYDFTGSTMDGETLGSRSFIQDTYIYTLNSIDSTEPDGTFHTDYCIEDVTGDVNIKLKPLMKKFGVSANGTGANEITLGKSYASYRTNLPFGKTDETLIDSITVGGQRLSLNKGYRYAVDAYGKENTNSFIIDGNYITGDVAVYATRTANDNPPIVDRETRLISSTGTEYDLEMSEFRRLKDGKCIYLIKAVGESGDYMVPCYDGHEMIYFEPYGAFVWLTISDEKSEDFYENAEDAFDELSEDEVYALMDERVAFGLSTWEEEMAIRVAVENYLLAGDLNEDYVVDDKDVELARELYMNTDPMNEDKDEDEDNDEGEDKNEDEKPVSLGLYLLADVNRSNTLDMRDVAKIKRLAEEAKPSKDKKKADKKKKSDENEEDEELKRSYTLEVSAYGKKDIVASPEEEIEIKVKLIRTDDEKDKNENAEVFAVQDELYYDADLFELLEGAKLSDGVQMTTFDIPADSEEDEEDQKEDDEDSEEEEKRNLQCINLSYLASEKAEKLEKENVLGVFRLKVIGDKDVTFSHDHALVIASDYKTEYPCETDELNVRLKEEQKEK